MPGPTQIDHAIAHLDNLHAGVTIKLRQMGWGRWRGSTTGYQRVPADPNDREKLREHLRTYIDATMAVADLIAAEDEPAPAPKPRRKRTARIATGFAATRFADRADRVKTIAEGNYGRVLSRTGDK